MKPKYMSRRVLISGGGTGGHIYPAISIANEFKKRNEEYGFIVAGLILFLYLILLFRIIIISYKSNSGFGKLVALSVGLPIILQALINMGVAVQLFPVTGQPLPLISMGGTSIWTTFLALGILLSVSNKDLNNETKIYE